MVDETGGFIEESRPSILTITPDAFIESKANDRASKLCRMLRRPCVFASQETRQCIDCAFLDGIHADSGQETAFLLRCRAIQEFVERTAIHLYSSHAAAVVLNRHAEIDHHNTRGLSFLRNNDSIGIRHGQLFCRNPQCQARFSDAIAKTIDSGKTTNLLVHPVEHPNQRLSMSLARIPLSRASNEMPQEAHASVLCLIARLDRRRFATARQLMELFGLSTAEARLARALCQGSSLEQYAIDGGLKMPTVRTQLRSVFAKTGTDKQPALIRLLAGIPVVRET